MSNLLRVLKPDTRKAIKEGKPNSLHEFCASENPSEIDLYHFSVHYTRSYIIHETDFVEKHGYEPTLLEVEAAMYEELLCEKEKTAKTEKYEDEPESADL